jgi:hypothetical protein
MDRRSRIEKNERVRRLYVALAWIAVGRRRVGLGKIRLARVAYDRSERIIEGLERERAAGWALN